MHFFINPIFSFARNNFKAEANVKFRKENKENTDLKVHEVCYISLYSFPKYSYILKLHNVLG